ncbi:zf-HC2 domain-containing protein [Streptomyces longispororuber]|uniref:zf-HC2 domain-containing protein n=1 Tax=Streptomyces longispororuber TaxID=68230 RepID=UPI0033D1D1C2
MRSLERHHDAGAYALGVLDAADAFRFEDHLVDCPACRARLAELAPPVRLLHAHRGALPAPPAPGPALLGRLLTAAAHARRARRRQWLGALAAGAVLAVAAPAAAVLAPDGAAPARLAAAGSRGGMSAALTARERAWGTEAVLRVRDPARRGVCVLVAVGRDGAEETVTTWRAPGRPLATHGGTALRPDRIDRFEVRGTGGARLLTLRPR